MDHERNIVMKHFWNSADRGNRSTWRKSAPVPLSHNKSHTNHPIADLGLCGRRLTANCLCHPTTCLKLALHLQM